MADLPKQAGNRSMGPLAAGGAPGALPQAGSIAPCRLSVRVPSKQCSSFDLCSGSVVDQRSLRGGQPCTFVPLLNHDVIMTVYDTSPLARACARARAGGGGGGGGRLGGNLKYVTGALAASKVQGAAHQRAQDDPRAARPTISELIDGRGIIHTCSYIPDTLRLCASTAQSLEGAQSSGGSEQQGLHRHLGYVRVARRSK